MESKGITRLAGISEFAYTGRVEIRFSRHVRNKIRLHKLTPDEVEEAISLGEKLDRGGKCESRFRKLKAIWLMVGSYALVVTAVRTG